MKHFVYDPMGSIMPIPEQPLPVMIMVSGTQDKAKYLLHVITKIVGKGKTVQAGLYLPENTNPTAEQKADVGRMMGWV